MIGVLRRVLAVAVLAALAFPAAAGAQAVSGDLDVTDIDPSAFPQVTATLGVPPALGNEAVPAAAFAVSEDGAARALEVTPLAPEELAVMLVVDTSGSMAGPFLSAAQGAARTFLAEMPPAARIGVIGFGAAPVLASPFSTDRSAAGGAVDSFTARGNTALYDALSLAIDQFPAEAGSRQAIVVLSDGGDTASAATLEDVVARLEATDLRLEVVELVTADSKPDALTQLAEAGNGGVTSASDPQGLAAIYQGIASSLANQYRIAFDSAASGTTELVFAVDHQGIAAERRLTVEFPVLTSPAPPSVPEQGLLAGGWGLVVGLGALILAMGVGGSLALAPSSRIDPDRLGPAHPGWVPRSGLGWMAGRASDAAEGVLERRGRRLALNAALERAGVALRPGEFLVVWGSPTLVALLVGHQLSGFVVGLLFSALVVFAARLYLKVRTSRRQAAFADQLTDTLQLLSGSLRAGYGLLQACEAVAKESPSPTSDEFRRVLVEARLGRDPLDSFHDMADRVSSQDFEWVVGAFDIHRDVGGDLAEVLDNVGGTIRDRDQLRRQVKALSAEGRLSAYVLLALPFAMIFVLQLITPGYLDELRYGVGRLLLIGAGFFMLVGALWLKRLCRLVF